MRNLKRALSVALASVMLLGMMVVGTGASYADVTSKHNKEAIEVMQLLGIMSGDESGNFNPDKAVTRNEMAVIMVNLMDLNIKDYAGSSPFVDVPAWAEGYVSACYANSIVSGTSATTYGGDQTVTTAQAALMIMKALGYFQYSSDFGEDWMVASVKQGSKIDLFDGVSSNASTALTRNDVALMILNALDCSMVEPDGNGGTTIKGEGFEITTGSTKYLVTEETLLENLFGGDVDRTDDNDALGRPATVWTYDDDEVMVVDEADYVVVLAKKYTDEQTLLNLAKNKIEAAEDIAYYLNADGVDFTELGAGDTLYFYLNDDDEVENVYAARYELDTIEDVDFDVTSDDEDDGIAAYVTFKTNGEYDDVDVAGFNAKTYVEDAMVALLIGEDDEIVDSYIVTAVEGSVGTTKQTSTQNYLTVGGTKYIEGKGATVVSEVSTGSDYTYKFYLDANGYMLGYEVVEDAAASIDEVYVLESVWYTATSGKNGDSEYTYYARLIALDGTVKVVELEEYGLDGEKALSDGTITEDALGLSAAGNGIYLVTISDKKVTKTEGSTTSTVCKKDDGKYNIADWDFEDDEYALSEKTLKGEVEADTSKNNSVRLNNKTQYLMFAVEDDEVTTAVYTGGVNFTFVEAENIVLVDADKTSTALYVIVDAGDKADNVKQNKVTSEDYVFVNGVNVNTAEQNTEYMIIAVYDETGAKLSWKVDVDCKSEKNESNKLYGFFTYTVNEDGYYELEKAAAKDDLSSIDTDWDEDKDYGYFLDATSIGYADLDDDLLDVADMKDLDVSKAKFVDLHDDDADGQYTKSISSLKKLTDLIDNGKVTSYELSLSVNEKGAVVIFLTSAEVPED